MSTFRLAAGLLAAALLLPRAAAADERDEAIFGAEEEPAAVVDERDDAIFGNGFQ